MRLEPETSSEAASNYGAAALLIGGAIFFAAIGVGYLKSSLFPSKEDEKDIGDVFTETLSNAAKEALEKRAKRMPTGEEIVQETMAEPVTFYVKKAYKPEVKLGDLIPDTFLVVKTPSINDKDWADMDNIKFTSTRKVNISGKATLYEVGQFLVIQ